VSVEIEKDNIDLLIHDEKHFFIIENKLNAVDQKHQFTRYIKTIADRFNIHCKEDLEKQIFLVYLSKNKQKPSKNSMSLKGFEFIDRTKVGWQNLEQEIVNRDKGTKASKTAIDRVNFPKGTTLHYHHLPYYLSANTASKNRLKHGLIN
jgi:hypothetical protein